MLRVKREELRFIRDQIKQLEASITPQSLKEFVVAGLELYLSFALVLSLFEAVRDSERDAQELRYLYRMAWTPLLWGLILAFGHKVLPSIAPSPDNFDRNLRISKLLIWLYSLIFLVWDDNMQIKRGPALHVAILFCFCDIARYEMEAANLIDDDDADDEDVVELEKLAEAVQVARTAQEQENAFKNQLHAIANQQTDQSRVEADEDDEDRPSPSVRRGPVPRGSIEASYRQYDSSPHEAHRPDASTSTRRDMV